MTFVVVEGCQERHQHVGHRQKDWAYRAYRAYPLTAKKNRWSFQAAVAAVPAPPSLEEDDVNCALGVANWAVVDVN